MQRQAYGKGDLAGNNQFLQLQEQLIQAESANQDNNKAIDKMFKTAVDRSQQTLTQFNSGRSKSTNQQAGQAQQGQSGTK